MVTTCCRCYKKFPNVIYQTDDDIGMYPDWYYECMEREYVCRSCIEKEEDFNDYMRESVMHEEDLADYDYNE